MQGALSSRAPGSWKREVVLGTLWALGTGLGVVRAPPLFFLAETGVTRLPESLSPTGPGRAGRLLLPWLPERTVSVLRGLHPGNSAPPLPGTLEAFAFPFLFSLNLGHLGGVSVLKLG